MITTYFAPHTHPIDIHEMLMKLWVMTHASTQSTVYPTFHGVALVPWGSFFSTGSQIVAQYQSLLRTHDYKHFILISSCWDLPQTPLGTTINAPLGELKLGQIPHSLQSFSALNEHILIHMCYLQTYCLVESVIPLILDPSHLLVDEVIAMMDDRTAVIMIDDSILANLDFGSPSAPQSMVERIRHRP